MTELLLQRALCPLEPSERAALEQRLLMQPPAALLAVATAPRAAVDVQHLALLVLRQVVERQWSAATVAERASLQAALLKYLERGAHHEALAGVLASIAVAELHLGGSQPLTALAWPQQRWLALLRALQLLFRLKQTQLAQREALALLHALQPVSPLALRVLRRLVLVLGDVPLQARPPWMQPAQLFQLPFHCAPTLRLWAALSFFPPTPEPLLYWIAGSDALQRKTPLVTRLIQRAAEPPAVAPSVIKAALLQLGSLGPLDDVSEHPAAKLWEALLDAGGQTLSLCVEGIKGALSASPSDAEARNRLLVVGLQALRVGAWQLWDQFSVPSGLSAHLPAGIWTATTGTLLPYALMCVSTWVSQPCRAVFVPLTRLVCVGC
jgi:hypothetical protein